MKQRAKTFPMLSIAGKFPSVQCKITDSLNPNGFPTLTGAKLHVPFKNKPVRSSKIRRYSQTFIVHGQRVIQTAWSLQDCSSTTETPEYGYALSLACRNID